MRKVIVFILFAAVVAVAFSSCIAAQNSYSGCPSHDKNFFRKN